MIARAIAWSARNLLLVLFGTAFAAAAGLYALVHLPLDAIPIFPTPRWSSTPSIPVRRRR
jgi:Cu/Ag efflux pump CusA